MYILEKESNNIANPPIYRWSCWYKAKELKRELKKEGII